MLKKKLKLEDRIERKRSKKEQKTRKKKRKNVKFSEEYIESDNDPIEISAFDSKVFAAPYYDPEMAPTLNEPDIENSGDFENNSTSEGSGESVVLNDQVIVDLDMTSVVPNQIQHVPEPRIRVGPNFFQSDEPLSRRPQIKLLNNANRPFTDLEINFDENVGLLNQVVDTGIEAQMISMTEQSANAEKKADVSNDSRRTELVLRKNSSFPERKNKLARSYDYLKFSALAALKAKFHSSLKLKHIMSLPVNEDKKDKLLASYQGISTNEKLVSRFQRFPDGDGKLTCFTCHEKTMEECYAKGKMVHCWESDACKYRILTSLFFKNRRNQKLAQFIF